MNKLARKTPNVKHVQVGRGGKRGKTAGRGTKGQKARAGHRMRPELRDIIKSEVLPGEILVKIKEKLAKLAGTAPPVSGPPQQ